MPRWQAGHARMGPAADSQKLLKEGVRDDPDFGRKDEWRPVVPAFCVAPDPLSADHWRWSKTAIWWS